MKPKLPDLSNMRGMSEPGYFAFNVLDKGRRMLCHAVIFSSFEIYGESERTLPMLNDNDPRTAYLTKYFLDNLVDNGLRAELKEEIQAAEKAVREMESRLADLRSQIAEAERKLKHNEQRPKIGGV